MTEPDHHVHGLAADQVPPDWPPLTDAEVTAVLAHYPLPARPQVRWRSPRPLSAAAVVETANGRVFVKRHHHSVRNAVTLAEEHAFMAHLGAQGIPVPAVLASREGSTTLARGPWTYEVHAAAAGRDLYRDTMSWVPPAEPTHAHAAGAMLARLHHAARSHAAQQRRTHVLVARCEIVASADPLHTLAAQLPRRPGLAAYLDGRDWRGELRTALAPYHARVQPRLAAQPPLWTHGDWHVSNLCWSGTGPDAQVSAVLDFGLAARTFALFDLATAIERNAIAWLELERPDAVRPAIARALLAGYASVRALSAADLDLLADLLPLVHVDFALSEVEYFAAVTGSRANAEVAYQTFLRGHAAWFPAAGLLDTIRGA